MPRNDVPPTIWHAVQHSRGVEYFVYGSNSGTIGSGSGTTGAITTLFNHRGFIFAISCAASVGTQAVVTAAVGNRDGFTIAFKRQNGTLWVTQEILASCLFGPYDGMWWLAKPWAITGNDTLQATITNKVASTLVVYVGYHLAVD